MYIERRTRCDPRNQSMMKDIVRGSASGGRPTMDNNNVDICKREKLAI